jgi:phage terminase large subunit-like protein
LASPPLFMTPVPAADVKRGDGELVIEFIERYCRVTKESLGGAAGTLLQMRPWQKNLISCVYARRPDGRRRHRLSLIGLPRKQGKSAVGSAIGLHGLIMGDYGSEIYSCAVDRDQARVVFSVAKRMVELDPEMSELVKPYRDVLEYTEKGSIYKVLSSEAVTKEGLNPNLVIYDELHGAPDPELFDVMTLAMGSRRDPMLVAITTAGQKADRSGQDSVCYKLYQQGVRICKNEIEDPTYFMAWFGVPQDADYKDPEVWARANPGYGDLIDPEDFESVIKRVHENEFRTKRLDQWVSAARAWLPQGSWNACRTDRAFTPGARGVVLGFDGSQNGDTTALVAVTIDSDPQVTVLGLWEKPQDAESDWRVPRGEVKDRIRQACHDYHVREVAADEYIWQDSLEELEAEGIPIVVFPQTLTRMAPATQRFYEYVANQAISHDGHPALARHFDNCQLKTDSRGSRLIKDAKGSPRKIDLAVATVMAADRAGYWLNEPLEGSIDGRLISDIKFVWDDGPGAGRVAAGEQCARCGNKVLRHPDTTQRLVRIGFQVVCNPPCGVTAPEPVPAQRGQPKEPQYVW